MAVTLVAATSEDVLLTLMLPVKPLVVKVKGEPVILIVGLEVGSIF